jgi:hypothetical protein
MESPGCLNRASATAQTTSLARALQCVDLLGTEKLAARPSPSLNSPGISTIARAIAVLVIEGLEYKAGAGLRRRRQPVWPQR